MLQGKTVPEYIDIMPDYISSCSFVQSSVYGLPNKTFVIEFKMPLKILSTLEGQREMIRFIGNHSAPIECWGTGHENGGMDAMIDTIYKTVGLSKVESSLLFTGADVENTAAAFYSYKDISLCALATAGVKSNAIRASRDEGLFYEPGTINIIILTNMMFSSSAMIGAIITATEAKTAALQDLDIRSSYSPMVNQATGTGTDNIIIVGGEEDKIEYAGGHTRMGEMIAKAVYDAVRDAVSRQNDIIAERDISERLSERGVRISDLILCDDLRQLKDRLCTELGYLSRESGYRSFIQSAFAISDHYDKGLIEDISSFKAWSRMIAEDIAGKEIVDMINFIESGNVPEPLRMALNAMLNGIFNAVQFEEDIRGPYVFGSEGTA